MMRFYYNSVKSTNGAEGPEVVMDSNRHSRFHLPSHLCALAVLICFISVSSSHAATLKTIDGKTITGQVTLSSAGFTIKSDDGTEQKFAIDQIADLDFREMVKTTPAEISSIGGLKGEYFLGSEFLPQFRKSVKFDPQIDFSWDRNKPASEFSAGPDDHQFCTRWTGKLIPRYSEKYTFFVGEGKDVRIWLDHRLVVDNRMKSGDITLTGGRIYNLRIDHVSTIGNPHFHLEWQSASQPRQVIPPQCFAIDTNDPDAPMGVRVVSPDDRAIFSNPADLQVAIQPVNGKKKITQAQLVVDDIMRTSTTQPPFDLSWPSIGPGEHVLKVKALTEDGQAATSAAVHVTIASDDNGKLPRPWSRADLGSPTSTATAAITDQTINLTRTGGDLYSPADQAIFLYQTFKGNGAIVAHVAEVLPKGANDHAIAGVMIRTSLAPGGVAASALYAPSVGPIFLSRPQHDQPADNATAPTNLGGYLKLERASNHVSGFRSDDDKRWELIGQADLPMTDTAYFGLVLAAGDKGVASSATFDHVTVGPLESTALIPAGVQLTDGTFLAGEFQGIDDGGAKLLWGKGTNLNRVIVIDPKQVSHVLLHPVQQQIVEQIRPDSSGAILTNGDLYEGTLSAVHPGNVTITNDIFGARPFNFGDLAVLVLHPPVHATGRELQLKDGTIIVGNDWVLGDGALLIKSGILKDTSVPLELVLELRAGKSN
jgi:PA14 domain